jgi:polynucleotide 5'-hydroxyl-kinase GRC3/NOL9
VLTDVAEAALEGVDSLVVGRLELPPALLQTARHLSPYLSLFSLATSGTGAGASKSRNNLARAGQL